MALLGRLHPLLVHFPIGLVLAAALAETAATLLNDRRWRAVAIANVRAGAVFGLLAAIAGWRFAAAPGMDATLTLAWHRWLGAIAAAATVVAAFASARADRPSRRESLMYRLTLFLAAALVGITGHFGGLLVWGADFLRL